MAPSILGVEKARKYRVRHISASQTYCFYFFFVPVLLLCLVLRQLYLLRHVRAQTAAKKRGNMWDMTKKRHSGS